MDPGPEYTAGDLYAPFRAGCARGELIFMRCASCGNAQLAAYRVCTACGGPSLRQAVSGGRGIIVSFTVVHRAPTPFFKAKTPFVLALIDLAEGFRAMMTVTGQGEPRIGAPVRVAFTASGPDGERLPEAVMAGDEG